MAKVSKSFEVPWGSEDVTLHIHPRTDSWSMSYSPPLAGSDRMRTITFQYEAGGVTVYTFTDTPSWHGSKEQHKEKKLRDELVEARRRIDDAYHAIPQDPPGMGGTFTKIRDALMGVNHV